MSRRNAGSASTPARAGGIDFAALAKARYDRASPEERARIDALRESRARAEATESEIVAVFERESMAGGVRSVDKRWEAPVTLRIEERPDGGEVIRFVGAVTGHEAYGLDEAFCGMLEDPDELAARPRFYVCAGTPGRWDACSVDPGDVAAYLRWIRPHLFAASPSP